MDGAVVGRRLRRSWATEVRRWRRCGATNVKRLIGGHPSTHDARPRPIAAGTGATNANRFPGGHDARTSPLALGDGAAPAFVPLFREKLPRKLQRFILVLFLADDAGIALA
eukprot:gene16871-biopygen13182